MHASLSRGSLRFCCARGFHGERRREKCFEFVPSHRLREKEKKSSKFFFDPRDLLASSILRRRAPSKLVGSDGVLLPIGSDRRRRVCLSSVSSLPRTRFCLSVSCQIQWCLSFLCLSAMLRNRISRHRTNERTPPANAQQTTPTWLTRHSMSPSEVNRTLDSEIRDVPALQGKRASRFWIRGHSPDALPLDQPPCPLQVWSSTCDRVTRGNAPAWRLFQQAGLAERNRELRYQLLGKLRWS